jgi:hypothetical protein
MEWKLQTLDHSVQPPISAHWPFPSKEAALHAACDVITRQVLIIVLGIETTDQKQRIELADIKQWCVTSR